MRRIAVLLCATLAVLGLAAIPAGAKKPAPAPTLDIVATALATSGPDAGAPDGDPGDYDVLIAAVLDQGLAGTLATTPDLTVFAPSDRAFQRLVADLTGAHPTEAEAITAVTGLPDAILANVLTYHVVADSLSRVDVIRRQSLTSLNGGVIRPRGVTLRDANTGFADPRLLFKAGGIAATNGVIHTIDRVLMPDPLAP